MTNIFHLSSPLIEKDELAPYAKLTNHQFRGALEREQNILVAETPWVVERALKSGVVPLSFLTDDKHLERAVELRDVQGFDAPIYVVDTDELAELTGYKLTRGLLSAMKRPAEKDVNDLVLAAEKLVVLEGLVDVTNVGACLRSAAALGADAIILSPDCADPLSRRSVRVSMGSVFQIPWARSEGLWPEGLIELLHEHEFCCIALALGEDSRDIRELRALELNKRALCFGNEGFGLSHKLQESCDMRVKIEMAHDVDSLNVASSSAVAFWELFN